MNFLLSNSLLPQESRKIDMSDVKSTSIINGEEYIRFWFVTIQKRNEFKTEEERGGNEPNSEDKISVIHLFVREFTDPYTKYHISIRDYEPYFFIRKDFLMTPESDRILDNDRIIDVQSYIEINGKKMNFRTLDNVELLKLLFTNTSDVPLFRDLKVDEELVFNQSFEADVLFQLRFLYDKKIRNGVLIPSKFIVDEKPPELISHKYIIGF